MTEAEAAKLLTPEACRAARGMLGWSMADLVREAGTSPNSIVRLENGGDVRPATALKIAQTLMAAGVEFLNGKGPGVRLTRPSYRGTLEVRPLKAGREFA